MTKGFRLSGAFDIDQEAVQNYDRNLPGSAFRADLTQGIPFEHRFRKQDVVIAGPPCQGFSTVGKRDIDDERNHLLPLVATLALRIRPKVIVVENVAGVVAGEHRRYWNCLAQTLRDAGYRTNAISLRTEAIGMAQARRRIILFAWDTGRDLRFVTPNRAPVSLREVLRNVAGRKNHAPQVIPKNSTIYKIARHIEPGQKLSNVRGGGRSVHTWDIPEVFGPTTSAERTLLELLLRLRRRDRNRPFGDADPVSQARLSAAFGAPYRRLVSSLVHKGYVRRAGDSVDLVRTFNGKFRRLDWDSPACTVDTRFGDARFFLHPGEQRGFTVREAARIQSFPDSYSFVGTEKGQYKAIGNAVPPALAAYVAGIVRELLVA